MPNREIARVETMDEYAFVCVQLDEESVSLRTSAIAEPPQGGFDRTHKFALDDFRPDCAVPFRPGCTGILRVLGVNYMGGGTDIIFTNSVFPEGRYRNDFGASTIARTELMLRTGDIKFV